MSEGPDHDKIEAVLKKIGFARTDPSSALSTKYALDDAADLIRDLRTEIDNQATKIVELKNNAVNGNLRAWITAAGDGLREAWSALSMVRETVETLGPIGAMPAAEHLDGPTFTHEAEAIVSGIRALASNATAADSAALIAAVPGLVEAGGANEAD
jgi:hypothetical protein